MKQNKERRPYVIGLTGTIASGKSSAARYLEERHGIPRIDADKVGHLVLEELQIELAAAFGAEIVEDGKISRKKLGSIVFADAAKLAQLNRMTHPVICAKIEKWIQENPAKVVMVEAIELLRSELKDMVDEVWVVYARPEVRVQRMMEERGLSEAEARRRVASQWEDQKYQEAADQLLDGSGSLEALYRQCDRKVNEERWGKESTICSES